MAVTDFSLAVDRYSKGEKVTDWFPIKCFDKLGERVNEHCRSGSQVGVEGRLQLEKWETQDGQKRSKAVIVANSVQFFGSKNDQAASSNSNGQGRSQQSGNSRGTNPPSGWGSDSGFGADDLSVDEIPF